MAKQEKVEQKVEQIDGPSMDAAKARAMIQEENRKRAQACMDEIQKVLDRHKCRLEFIEIRVNGQIQQALFHAVAIDEAGGG